MILGNIPNGWKLGRVKVGGLGKSNVLGKKWYHSVEKNEEKYFNSKEIIPKDYIKGRLKKEKK